MGSVCASMLNHDKVLCMKEVIDHAGLRIAHRAKATGDAI